MTDKDKGIKAPVTGESYTYVSDRTILVRVRGKTPPVLKEALRLFPSDRNKSTNAMKRKVFLLGATWMLEEMKKEGTTASAERKELERRLDDSQKKAEYWHGLYRKGRL